MCICVIGLCMGTMQKGNTGTGRGGGGSNVVRALKLGSKWSLVGGGKKLNTHTYTHRARERLVKNFCLFVCLFAS
jgi:hypothetical protein